MGKECSRLRADLKSFSLSSRGKINCSGFTCPYNSTEDKRNCADTDHRLAPSYSNRWSA